MSSVATSATSTGTGLPVPVLRLTGISKAFPGVQALSDVHLDVTRGEVHALIGENGAGKSTLMKILYGVHQPDTGTIELNGNQVKIGSPHQAQQLGISMVHQELNLIRSLDVARNIFLGREPTRGAGLIDWPKLYAQAREILDQLRINLNPRTLVKRLSVAQMQLVEIAHAISWNPSILILDEPTSSLTQQEIGDLFNILRNLKATGTSILYISHRLEELEQIADRASVLRDGKFIATVDARTTPIPELIRMMVGRSLSQQYPKETMERGAEVLRVEHLTRHGVFRDVSFSVCRGEIVGMAGLVGAGRSEVARALFGADPKDGGKVYIEGSEVTINSPDDAIEAGIGLLPEDRKMDGLVLVLPVKTNSSLTVLDRFSTAGVINHAKRDAVVRRAVEDLRIRTPGINFRVGNLSGGNQQKVVLSKWINSRPKMLIFDEPTRGIDVGAKVEVYNLINQLAKGGVGILIISSELPEVLGMCDRILVMHEGRLVANLPRAEATQESVISYASGEEVDE
jgi:ribose transport system ATP-binding protein